MSNKVATTLGKAPKARAKLTEIKVEEVSIVDMPANGEPFVVVKGMKGSTMANKVSKLGSPDVSRRVLKAIDNRMNTALDSIREINSIVKNMKVDEKNENPTAPIFLVKMLKSAAADLRSMQPNYFTKRAGESRTRANSVLPIQSLTKRDEDIEKANAVSYLMRDQYVSVTQSITEYMTTFVEGIEHDDTGPILIPDNLSETVEQSAGDLEKLADQYPVEGEDDEAQVETSEVAKLQSEIERMTKSMSDMTATISSANNEAAATVEKSGSKMAADRLKRLQGVSSSMKSANEELEKLLKELEDKESEDVVETTKMDTTDKPVEPTPETPVVPVVTPEVTPVVETPVAPVTTPETPAATADEKIDRMTKAFETLINKLDERFGSVEKSIKDQNDSVKIIESRVEKMDLSRTDSKVPAKDPETPVQKSNSSSFASILHIPGLK